MLKVSALPQKLYLLSLKFLSAAAQIIDLILVIRVASGKQVIRKAFDHVDHLEMQSVG